MTDTGPLLAGVILLVVAVVVLLLIAVVQIAIDWARDRKRDADLADRHVQAHRGRIPARDTTPNRYPAGERIGE